jgi:hypothetical protein
MNARIKQLATEARLLTGWPVGEVEYQKFAELIVKECVNREELLGAIARGWCSEKNSHKTMDSDLAVAIFDEVERQIKKQFGVEE